MPQLGNRPAGADDCESTQQTADQCCVRRPQECRAGTGDHCAGGIGGLSENREKARRPAAHIIGREDLHDCAPDRHTDGVVEAQGTDCEKTHPERLRQSEKTQAESEASSQLVGACQRPALLSFLS